MKGEVGFRMRYTNCGIRLICLSKLMEKKDWMDSGNVPRSLATNAIRGLIRHTLNQYSYFATNSTFVSILSLK